MKNKNIQICDITIHPGESLSLALPLPELFSCAPLYMPIKVVHGKEEGPTVLVIAGVHGNELNGTEIINQLLATKSLSKLKGTLIAVPVVNVYGLINRSPYLPGGIDLDKCFPGSSKGAHAARLADMFINEVFSKADVCIDLQTGPLNYTNLPQLFIDYENERAEQLAANFNAPVISKVKLGEGSLAKYAKRAGVPYICYEAGEAMRFDEGAIKVGLKGIRNILKKLDMLPTKTAAAKDFKSYFTEETTWVRASSSGISHSDHGLGQHVKKGELLGTIKDPFGASESVDIHAPAEAVIVGVNNLPLVHEGEALFQLAIFPHKVEKTAEKLEAWVEKHDEELQS